MTTTFCKPYASMSLLEMGLCPLQLRIRRKRRRLLRNSKKDKNTQNKQYTKEQGLATIPFVCQSPALTKSMPKSSLPMRHRSHRTITRKSSREPPAKKSLVHSKKSNNSTARQGFAKRPSAISVCKLPNDV